MRGGATESITDKSYVDAVCCNCPSKFECLSGRVKAIDKLYSIATFLDLANTSFGEEWFKLRSAREVFVQLLKELEDICGKKSVEYIIILLLNIKEREEFLPT
jgi:hypothetical protein